MSAPLPRVIISALDDVSLPATARLLMWHLAGRLDVEEWTEVKHESLAREARIKAVTVSATLTRLVQCGYLCERRVKGQLREYRLPASRRSPLASPSAAA